MKFCHGVLEKIPVLIDLNIRVQYGNTDSDGGHMDVNHRALTTVKVDDVMTRMIQEI